MLVDVNSSYFTLVSWLSGARRRRSGGALEGSALVCPPASPHLPVVGAGSPEAVPSLAR
jgi:hypothetical protein